jgi:hypothetical protein
MLIVYAAVATPLVEKPVATAIALIVSVLLMVIGRVYFVEEVVGVVSSVV